jgi:hypothetical protein
MPRSARSPWRTSVALALASVSLVAAGCGDRGTGDGSSPAAAAASPSTPSHEHPPEDAAQASPPAATPAPHASAEASPTVRPPKPTSPKGQEGGATAPAAVAGADAPRSDRFADLEVLCAALNKDYVDGTLTDYYGALNGKMKTAFGDDLRRRGEASMEPGRILEAGRKTLGDAAGDPATPACDKLFDELDDLE